MLTNRHPMLPMTELVRDLSPEAQALAIPAIQRVLNQAHHFQERMDEARDIERQFNALEHKHPPFVAPLVGCERCAEEDRYIAVIGSGERARACLEGRAA